MLSALTKVSDRTTLALSVLTGSSALDGKSLPFETGCCDWLLTLKGLLGTLTPPQATATVCLREELGV